MLVGVSVAWYTQFETGAIRVSPRMLDRVAAALRLNDEEKLYLFLSRLMRCPPSFTATRQHPAQSNVLR